MKLRNLVAIGAIGFGLLASAQAFSATLDVISNNSIRVSSFSKSFDGNSTANLGASGNLGVKDFNIGFYVKTDSQFTQSILGNRYSCGGGAWVYIRAGQTGAIFFELHDNANGYQALDGSTLLNKVKLNDGHTHKVSIARKGKTITLKVDEFKTSIVTTSILDVAATANVEVGAGGCSGFDGTQNFVGTLSNVSISSDSEEGDRD